MELFVTLLLFAGSTTITPGPNNIMIMTSGANFGIRGSLPHYLGICRLKRALKRPPQQRIFNIAALLLVASVAPVVADLVTRNSGSGG